MTLEGLRCSETTSEFAVALNGLFRMVDPTFRILVTLVLDKLAYLEYIDLWSEIQGLPKSQVQLVEPTFLV